ncbi:MAG: hypothetical protein A2103_03725 [Gammaproteobacteria bacterium GWF2_41_13]|nr:MAG: hypothetical protein A2103_03725 [Gammaproteobacteria bacterium GWF2_41_13]
MYRYPDIDDMNFSTRIYTPDWDDGGLEYVYLEDCIHHIPERSREVLLDAGCGYGKQLPKLAPYFKKIVAIDPDKNRLEKAKLLAQEQLSQAACRFEFLTTAIQDFNPTYKFDCVFCSQILQHVHTLDAVNMLNKFHDILESRGHLILLTTNCLEREDVFLKVDCTTNEHIPLNEESYNECTLVNNHYLPTHLFTEKTLREMLIQANFDLIFIKKFNGYPKIKGDNFIFARAL